MEVDTGYLCEPSGTTIIKCENCSLLVKVKEFESLFLNCCMRNPAIFPKANQPKVKLF